ALLRPWRLLGRLEGQFRDRAQDRPAGRAPGVARSEALHCQRMPARRDAYRPGDGAARHGRSRAAASAAPDRAGRARLRRRPAANMKDPMNDIVTNPPVRARRALTRADILPLDEYVKIRTQRRRETTELKRRRRIEVGPFATFYFENFATMWQQVQEMLYIEKGGDEQLADELEA